MVATEARCSLIVHFKFASPPNFLFCPVAPNALPHTYPRKVQPVAHPFRFGISESNEATDNQPVARGCLKRQELRPDRQRQI